MKKLIFLLILGLFISENRVFAQPFHNYYIAGIEVSGDGSRFAITGRQVTSEGQVVFPVDIYDSETYEIVASVPLRAIPTSFGLNRDGTKLGYVFPMTEFGIIELETMAFVSQEGTTMIEYEDLAWSPIYNDVYAYGLGSAVFVAESSDFPGGYHQSNSRIVGISWTIEGNLIGSQYNLTTREMSLALWEPNSTEPIVTLSNYGGGSHLALSLANGLVAVEGLNGISIFDGNLSFVTNLDDMSYSLAWSPDGTKLAVASGDSLNIWDVGTGTLVQTFETNTLNVIWLPNGDLIHDGDEPGLYQNGIWVQELVPPIACDLTIPAADTPTLLSAITSANTTPEADTICLEAGTYTLTTSHNNSSDGANGLPVITSDITLHGLGSGATILRDSAAPAFRILKVDTGARLVLDNITVSGGDAGSGNGGGIRNLGTLELRDSIIENNVASSGGGIRSNDNATLLVENSTIRNNISTGNGGGIYSNTGSTTHLSATIFSGNQANLSSGLGGGLFMNGAVLSINDGAFGGNQARNGAGLFVNTASQPVEISGTGFLNNSATNHGGGMYLNAVTVTLDGVTFSGNTSTSVGGGIRNGGTLTVTNSSFTGNHGSSGGGIANYGTLDLQAVQMSGNTVVVASGWGAAVFAQGAVTVNGGTFENHAARHGGAFYVDGTTLAADGAQILSNSATNRGGGVYFNGTLTGSYIHGSCLTGNTASDGNAVYSAVSTLDATGNWWGAGGSSGQVNNRVNASNPLSDCTPQMQQMAASLAMQQSSTVTTVSLPYQDTFESALNWSRSGTWSREAVGGYTEAGWVADATLRNMESVLESRVAFSIPRNRDAVVRFWQMGNLSAEDRVLLEVLPQGSQNWVVVDQQSGLQSGWTERSVVLTGYRNQAIRLRWRVISGSEESVGIEYRLDELRVETQR